VNHIGVSFLTALALVQVPIGCVRVTGGQGDDSMDPVDTGWRADTNGVELPLTEPCTTAQDCVNWVVDPMCLEPRCIDGWCDADEVGDGTPCTDGQIETQGDACKAGLCVPGPQVCVCSVDAECSVYDDLNVCNGTLVCDGCDCLLKATEPGAPCDDGDPQTLGDLCNDDGVCEGEVP
jgi:hypothetical protein